MNAWKLGLSMAATLAIIFGLTTLVFTAVLFYFGLGLSLVTIGILVVAIEHRSMAAGAIPYRRNIQN